MEFMCAGLAFLTFTIFILVAVVRGAWILVGKLFLWPDVSSRPLATAACCPCCDRPLSEPRRYCARCGLEVDGAESRELEELNTAARQVGVLVAEGELGADTADDLHERFELRQLRLLHEARIDDVYLARRLATIPFDARIERLLDAHVTIASLTATETQRLLAWIERLSPDDRLRMSAQHLWKCAQFLRREQRSREALALFRLLRLGHPASDVVKAACLEAARYASSVDEPTEAREFLAAAERWPLSEQETRFVAELRAELDAPVVGLAPIEIEMTAPPRREVVPAPPEPEAPAAPARTFQEMLHGFMEERNILWVGSPGTELEFAL